MITRLHFMTRTYRYVATGLLFWVAWAATAKDVVPYKNPKLTVNERVNDLLRRMTLEEKVGQLMCTLMG